MGAFSNLSYLMIETNSACNLACLSCNRTRLVEKGWRNEKKVTIEQWRRMLDVFKDCPLEIIKVEGLSEPMLHPEFDELLKIVREYFPKAFVIIATNLQYNFLTSPFLKALPFVDMVYLSIDATGDLYEKLRFPGKWSVVKNWLDVMKQEVSIEDCQKKLHINFTVTEQNIGQLPAIYQLRNNYHLASVRINLAQDWNGDRANAHVFSPSFLSELKKYKADIKGVAGWNYRDCFWAYEGIIVDVFGDVRQCVINTSQQPLGNIFSDEISKVYNEGVHYKELRKKLSCNQPGEGCENCDYKFLAPKLESLLGGAYFQNSPRKFRR